MTYHNLSDYAYELQEEEASCYRDACREAIDAFIGDRYNRALYLALAVVGQDEYSEWREGSYADPSVVGCYDTPTIKELVDLAIEFESVEDVAARLGVEL